MYTIYADDALLYSPGDEELSVLSPVLETQCNAAGTLTFVLLPEHPMYSALHKCGRGLTSGRMTKSSGAGVYWKRKPTSTGRRPSPARGN